MCRRSGPWFFNSWQKREHFVLSHLRTILRVAAVNLSSRRFADIVNRQDKAKNNMLHERLQDWVEEVLWTHPGATARPSHPRHASIPRQRARTSRIHGD